MHLTKGSRRVLVVGWGLVLASTLWPPVMHEYIQGGRLFGEFQPVWRVLGFGMASMPYATRVEWSTLAVIWTWIGLGVGAGVWLLQRRSN